MLQAALPQVKECGDLVELCVCDNASPDSTQEVVEESRALGPLKYWRNESNLGFHGNIVKLTTKLAQGEYVWLLGDDDLLLPGAVVRVLETLKGNRSLDAFWANYRIAYYPADWPSECIGGFDGSYLRLNVESTENRIVDRWQQFLRPESELCTAMMAHIIRRRIWVEYWSGRPVSKPKARTLESIFPHNLMFADTLMRRPGYFIGQPVLSVFFGSATYVSINPIIWLFIYPQLLHYYHKNGLAGEQWKDCVQQVFANRRWMLVECLRDESKSALGTVISYLRGGWRYAIAWKTLAQAVRGSGRPWLLNSVLWTVGKLNKLLRFGDLWAAEKREAAKQVLSEVRVK
jgi:glycosyltransferase involved in cell wall biosynthesis